MRGFISSLVATVLFLLSRSHAGAAIFIISDGDIDALKSAINISNGNGEDDTIELAANGTYTVAAVDNYYVNALPAISNDSGHSLTIHGNGATLQRDPNFQTPPLRFFSLNPGATLIVDALTMLGGDVRNAPGNTSTVCGAAAYNHGGVLIVVNSAFRGNRANIGGAIYNDGEYDAITLQLTNCVLEDNSALLGGAIDSYSPAPSLVIAIDQCTFTQNSATGSFNGGRGGGAIMIDTYGTSTSVTITHSAFTRNSAFSMSGGAICNRGGNITVMNSSFLQNYASEGGVVYNNGASPANLILNTCFIDGNSNCAIVNHGNSGSAMAIIRDSSFTNNYNPYWGGAIWNGGDHGAAIVEIANCSFIHNAANFAGAVYNDCFDHGSAALTVTTTTFDTNSANQIGGAIMNAAESTGTTNCDVNSCTFNNNFAVSGISIANGLYAPGDPNLEVQLRNSIFQTWTNRDNLVGDPGTIVSLGYNLTNDDGSGVLNATGDQINTDAMLDLAGPQDNGGPTQTIALLSGSPAIDSGDPAVPERDQRYYMRTAAPDIGAFEYDGALAPIRTVSRKPHGSLGMFDLDLALSGPPGIECRSGGANGDHRLVLDFATPITFQNASIVAGTGEVQNTIVSGSEAQIDLTGVANAQQIVVLLSGVNDGAHTNDVNVQMGLLLGDVDGSGSVNAADVAQTKARLGQNVDATNFRSDVNANGSINAADTAIVKQNSGTSLPP